MDLNNDGRLDILTGSLGGEIHVFYRKPNGTFAAGTTLRRSFFRSLSCGSSTSVAATDWDADNDIDLVVGNSRGEVYLVINKGNASKASWAAPARIKAKRANIQLTGSAGPCVADWDGDGKGDLLLGSSDGAVGCYVDVDLG